MALVSTESYHEAHSSRRAAIDRPVDRLACLWTPQGIARRLPRRSYGELPLFGGWGLLLSVGPGRGDTKARGGVAIVKSPFAKMSASWKVHDF